MSDLDDFLKVMSEAKRKDPIAKKIKEVKTSIKEDLGDLFSQISVIKEQDPVQQKHKKIEKQVQESVKMDLGDLFSQLSNLKSDLEQELVVAEAKLVEVKQEKVLTKVTPTPIPAVPEIKTPEQRIKDTNADVDKYLTGKTFQQPDPDLVSKDVEAIRTKIKFLEQAIGKIAATGPGGGEVNLRWLDDVDRSTIADGLYLRYNDTKKKFEFAAVSGGGVSQIQSDWNQTTNTALDFIKNKPTLATAAITGGTINGATIGATTPSTGNFTTLTSTNDATISGDLIVNGTTTTIGLATGASTITLGRTSGDQTVNIATGNTGLGVTKFVNVGTGASGASSLTVIAVGPTTGPNTITLGQTTATQTVNIATGATAASTTKTINIGTGGTSGTSTTNVTIGGTGGGGTYTFAQTINTHTVNIATGNIGAGVTKVINIATGSNTGTSTTNITLGSGGGLGTVTIAPSANTHTINIATGGNTSATKTLNLGTGSRGGATNITIGATAGTSTTRINGDLVVNGTTTTINTTTLTVDDKNIELGSVTTPSDTTADGGGITLKGASDKTFRWISSTSAWTSSEHLAVDAGKTLRISGSGSGTTVIQANATASGTLTLPSLTGTLATLDGTETFTNKTLTSPTLNGVATFADGSQSAPSIARTGDLDTGIYFPVANSIAVVAGGAQRLTVSNAGVTATGAFNHVSGSFTVNSYSGNKSAGITLISGSVIQYAELGNGGSFLWGDYDNENGEYGSTRLTLNSTGLAIQNGLSVQSQALFASGVVGTPSISTLADTNTGIFFPAADTIAFTEGGVESMRIDSAGNVGIGTTTPSTKLDVIGQAIFQGSTTPANRGVAFGAVNINNNSADGIVDFTQGLVFTDNTSGIGAWTHAGIVATGSVGFNGSLVFGTDGTGTNANVITERMRIDSAGNVGIGTTTPGYKLQVNGSFAATSKSFVIPHPTKEGKQLRYGSLEGPENGVYIRGKLKDNNIIELPEYWTKLVDPDSITVSLTSIGKHQNLYVDSIENNKVVIGNGNLINKNINCFFVVYAERIDIDKLVVEL